MVAPSATILKGVLVVGGDQVFLEGCNWAKPATWANTYFEDVAVCVCANKCIFTFSHVCIYIILIQRYLYIYIYKYTSTYMPLYFMIFFMYKWYIGKTSILHFSSQKLQVKWRQSPTGVGRSVSSWYGLLAQYGTQHVSWWESNYQVTYRLIDCNPFHVGNQIYISLSCDKMCLWKCLYGGTCMYWTCPIVNKPLWMWYST